VVNLSVINIIKNVILIENKMGFILTQKQCQDISNDLVNIALNSKPENVTAAVRCLTQLILHITNDLNTFLSLAHKCFYFIFNTAKDSFIPENQSLSSHFNRVLNASTLTTIPPSKVGNIMRSLVVLCAICEESRLLSRLIYGSRIAKDYGYGKDLGEKKRDVENETEMMASKSLVGVEDLAIAKMTIFELVSYNFEFTGVYYMQN
jgi:hypothetical protein